MTDITILQGDALTMLRTLPAESVHCCVTSPPYLGLRSYLPADHPEKATEIGFGQTIAEYIAALVEVFREVKRVLRADGTLWLNLGDSYNGSGGAGGDYGKGGIREGQPKYPGRHLADLKNKDLIGVPWRVAFALQEDGWWLRSEIIWAKRSPMPESVTDRPTRSHEQIFLLAKSRRYYYNQDATREPMTRGTAASEFTTGKTGHNGGARVSQLERHDNPAGRNQRDVWTLSTEPQRGTHYATFPTEIPRRCILAGCPAGGVVLDPFAGSGTTLAVAVELGRGGIGVELSAEYVRMARARIDALGGR